MKTYPILMADIIGSRIHQQQPLARLFEAHVAKVNRWFRDDIESPLTITLGDEFQGVVANLQVGISIMLALDDLSIFPRVEEECSYSLRFELLNGPIETPINPERAYGMMGRGLTEARARLEHKSDERFSIHGFGDKLDLTLNGLFFVYQGISARWDGKDGQLIRPLLDGIPVREVAGSLGVTSSSIYKRRKTLLIKEAVRIREVLHVMAQGV